MAAEFLDGVPTNLEAAALDALEWLKFWQGYLKHHHLGVDWNGNRKRMSSAIEMLDKFLPDEQPVYSSSPQIPTANIVVTTPSPFTDTGE